MSETLTYSGRDMHCLHCRAAITRELEAVAGVESVDMDLGNKRVTVTGKALDVASLRAAIDEAGCEAAA